jgi:anti-sigma regulatory factor (Ser/Thr protein kinase)
VSPRESNPVPLSLRLRGRRAISHATDAARSFGIAHDLQGDDLARLCIVVEELVANLYDHGGVTGEDEIQLALASDPKGIRMTIIDPGAPFNPWSRSHDAVVTKEEGAAGISLIKAWADLIAYSSSGEGNRLELLLPFAREG